MLVNTLSAKVARRSRVFAVVLAVVFGCNARTTAANFTSMPQVLVVQPGTSCLFSDNFTPIPTPSDPQNRNLGAELRDAILPSFLTSGLSRLGAALAKAGAKQATTVSAATAHVLSERAPFGCVYFISGRIVPRGTEGAKSLADALSSKNLIPREVPVAVEGSDNKYPRALGDVFILEPLSFFAEVEMTYAVTGSEEDEAAISAVAARPTAVHYGAPFAAKGRGDRDMLMFLAFAPPKSLAADDPSAFDTAAGVVRVSLGRMTIGESYQFESPSPSTSWAPLSLGRKGLAKSVWISVTETRDGNAFLAFLGEILGGSKDKVQTALENNLLSSKQSELEKAEVSSAAQRQVDLNKYETARGVAIKALSVGLRTCASFEQAKPAAQAVMFPDTLDALQQARSAQRAAIGAAIAVDEDAPFDDRPGATSKRLVKIPAKVTETSESCAAMRDDYE